MEDRHLYELFGYVGLAPIFGFSTAQTAQPLYGRTLPGGTTIGHPFASFLLGDFNSANISNVQAPQYRKSSWALYVQDTWKISRKLTLDYGIRWDLQKPHARAERAHQRVQRIRDQSECERPARRRDLRRQRRRAAAIATWWRPIRTRSRRASASRIS